MPLNSGKRYKTFFIRIGFVYLTYSVVRLLFYILNFSHFSDLSIFELLKIFFFGLRFDSVSIIAINGLFILLSLIPYNERFGRIYHQILLYIFVVFNSIGMAANMVDCGYFRFTFSRSTFDLFNVLKLGDDFSTLLWQYVIDFWYLFLIWIGFIASYLYVFKKTNYIIISTGEGKKIKRNSIITQISIALAIIFIGFIGIRGGGQLRPIGIVTAGNYTSSKHLALVLNTPFTIIKTIGKPGLSEVEYFNNTIAQSYFSSLKKPSGNPIKKDNVIIIILESFSKEYIGSLNNNKGYTPFLDSLIGESLVFENSFANGKRSIEGIPAILSGIPSLMNEAYITSVYSGNSIESVASLLKTKGYTSSFFHGGTNGTMGFDNFVNMAGFDNYYGRTEYDNENDFDGKWGIYDEPFLQFYANKLSTTPQPFISSVFTLSSHHPYKIPEKYKDSFISGTLKIHKSISYTDMALRKFFATASKSNWFDSTLFIITADHTSESEFPEYQSRYGMYKIPLFFYKHNSNLKGKSEIVAQQTDILPTILDYLGYDSPYICFGNNLLDSTNSCHFAINYTDEVYQIISGDYSLLFDGSSAIALYNIKDDLLMKTNLLEKQNAVKSKLLNMIKAIIQNYNHRMIRNKLNKA